MKVVLFVLMLAMLCGVASATTYHVTTSGNDTFDGLSWGTALKTIEASTTKADTPGDIVEIADGNYGHEHVTIDYSGNSTDYIIFRKYNGTVTIDGVDDAGHGFYLHGKSYVIIEGFNITRYFMGVLLEGYGCNCTIRCCNLYDNHHKAIRACEYANYTTISHNDISDTYYGAVSLTSAYNTFIYNNVHDSRQSGVEMTGGGNCNYQVINHNIFSSLGWFAVKSCNGGDDWSAENNTVIDMGRGGFECWSSKRIRISGNRITNVGSHGSYKLFDGGPGGSLKVLDVIVSPVVGTHTVTSSLDTIGSNKIKFPDNRMFWENSSNIPQWYTNRSELGIYGVEAFTIVVYNATVLPTDTLTLNITTFTEALKRWNESAAVDTYALYTIHTPAVDTTYTVCVYADANGSKMQTFRIKSNSTGYITYNTTGYGYPRWTEIVPAPESPGTLVVIAVFGAVLFGGGLVIRRWMKKN